MLNSSIQISFAGASASALRVVEYGSRPREVATEAVPSAPTPVKQRFAGPTSDAEFRALYNAHFRLVWCALSRLGVRDMDLVDQTQKVFLTAHLKLPEFEGRSQLSTWLWGICRRVAMAYRRSAAIRYEIATDPGRLEFSSEQQSGAGSEVDAARQAAVEHILNKLSEPQRIVFTLFEVDELAGPEIAALLNISVGTVRSRLRYARKLFRREVQRLAVANAFANRKGP